MVGALSKMASRGRCGRAVGILLRQGGAPLRHGDAVARSPLPQTSKFAKPARAARAFVIAAPLAPPGVTWPPRCRPITTVPPAVCRALLQVWRI